MKFTIDSDELSKGMRRAIGVAGNKIMPVLQNVLIKAGSGKVAIAAFDMSTAVTTEHEASVDEKGEALINAKALADIAKVAAGKVEFSVNRAMCATIKTGTAKFEVACHATEDFPQLFSLKGERTEKIDGKSMLAAIRSVEHAICADQSREMLMGMHLCQTGLNTRCEATDGHRLAIAGLGVSLKAIDQDGIVVPGSAVREFRKAFEEAPESEWELGIAESVARLSRPGVSILVRLLDAAFPDVSELIPPRSTDTIVDREEFSCALKRVSMMSGKDLIVSMKSSGGDTIELRASDGDSGRNAVDVVHVCEGNSKVAVSFNSRYMLDVLSALDAERIALSMPPDDQTPVVIRRAGDDSFVSVVMPTRM